MFLAYISIMNNENMKWLHAIHFNIGAEFSSSPYNILQKEQKFLKNNQPKTTTVVVVVVVVVEVEVVVEIVVVVVVVVCSKSSSGSSSSSRSRCSTLLVQLLVNGSSIILRSSNGKMK